MDTEKDPAPVGPDRRSATACSLFAGQSGGPDERLLETLNRGRLIKNGCMQLLEKTTANLTAAADGHSLSFRLVVIAQLVESKLVELVVAGSNPVDHPTLHPEAQRVSPERGVCPSALLDSIPFGPGILALNGMESLSSRQAGLIRMKRFSFLSRMIMTGGFAALRAVSSKGCRLCRAWR